MVVLSGKENAAIGSLQRQRRENKQELCALTYKPYCWWKCVNCCWVVGAASKMQQGRDSANALNSDRQIAAFKKNFQAQKDDFEVAGSLQLQRGWCCRLTVLSEKVKLYKDLGVKQLWSLMSISSSTKLPLQVVRASTSLSSNDGLVSII